MARSVPAYNQLCLVQIATGGMLDRLMASAGCSNMYSDDIGCLDAPNVIPSGSVIKNNDGEGNTWPVMDCIWIR